MYRTTKSNHSNQTDNMINQLYGKEFDGFSQIQKEFIRDNLNSIHRITQSTLSRNGYPGVAIQTGQEGTNIVSFDLHPNGDITNLQLKKPIGYAALDENTLEVIRIAYKDYPRPAKTTKIVFYVRYSLH
ncbi:MAG: periplasmic protein TonB [Campylobacterota bacterium]|nr:periplasmic protein TonB [Campylobacterota bacterium]